MRREIPGYLGLAVKGETQPRLREPQSGETRPCLREPQSEGSHSSVLRQPSLRRAPLPKEAPRLKQESRPVVLTPSRGPWRTVLGFTPVVLLSQSGQVAEGGRWEGCSELSEPGGRRSR